MRSAWKRVAFAGVVCSPALMIVAGLATASEDAATLSSTEYKVTPEDAAKVSPEVAGEVAPDFTPEFLADPANFEVAKTVWETCGGCHGSRAYPGKAPKLRPKRYSPQFIFHQVTFGSKNGKMPPFGDAFTHEERMAVAAWVLSKDFAP
jgi:hypothetical protein